MGERQIRHQKVGYMKIMNFFKASYYRFVTLGKLGKFPQFSFFMS